jgi:7-dehydrocholesterol reductase
MSDKAQWGRNLIADRHTIGWIIVMFVTTPFLVLLFQIANYNYDGSILRASYNLLTGDFYKNIPSFSWYHMYILIGWLCFQIILAMFPDYLSKIIPFYSGSRQKGQITPAGLHLEYNINGLQSWLITHLLAVILVVTGLLDGSWIAKNWLQMFFAANLIGYSLTCFAYLKAYIAPSHPKDNKTTGCWIYDLVMGIEFNPRCGPIDLKLFFNGRPGIIAWSLINFSFMMYQKEKFGSISGSMILVNCLQLIYIIDFFWNESWYLRTIDIAHDHFGWMLAWGDTVWLPFMYTLQCSYLSNNQYSVSDLQFMILLLVGIFGYVIFRMTNYQKDYSRRNDGMNKTIWGKPPKFVICEYHTSDGQIHHSKLLISGFWGISRHMNYVGDIILSACFCAACGPYHILPYFYVIYMTLLLTIRCIRDEQRCKMKYGHSWDEYCKKVPYRMIPYLV